VAPRLEDLDGRERRNHVLVIARYRVDDEDCARLNRLFHLRVTLLVTYSGIADDRIESFPSWVAATSLRTATARGALPQGAVLAAPGARSERLTRAPGRGGGVEPGRARHVFTGLTYRDQITAYHRGQRSARALSGDHPAQDRPGAAGTSGATPSPRVGAGGCSVRRAARCPLSTRRRTTTGTRASPSGGVVVAALDAGGRRGGRLLRSHAVPVMRIVDRVDRCLGSACWGGGRRWGSSTRWSRARGRT
jgi:hypothetical protein